MCIHHLLKFLDNSTIAGLVAVFAGAIIGRSIYNSQKKVDRKYSAGEKLAEAALLLEEHCKAINQGIDRLANTYQMIVKEGDQDRLKAFAESLKFEIEPMGMNLMYKIPEDISKIESFLSIYFSGDKKVEEKGQKVFDELKTWHDFVQNHATGKSGQPFDLSKRVKEIPELSLEKLDTAIKELIQSIK